jgi:hypothetical protein
MMEAALRLGQPERVLDYEREAFAGVSILNEAQATLLGIAHAAAGDLDRATHWLAQMQRQLQQDRPYTGKIDRHYRALLEQTVTDQERVQALRSYFEEG